MSNSKRVIASGTAGVLELCIFHPIDTISKRLMSNESNLRLQLFKNEQGIWNKYKSLFPGLGFAAGYKVLQRIYKFAGQPILSEILSDRIPQKTWREAVSGSLIGIGEVLLLPLDVLKIKKQTNQSLQNIRLRELYKGAGWTAMRNAPGSFALFGGNQFVRNLMDTSFFSFAVSSMVGSLCSILISAPIDVIKTRVQNKPFGSNITGLQVIRNLVKNEGYFAFYKGIVPKVVVVGPKLMFSFTIAQYLMNF